MTPIQAQLDLLKSDITAMWTLVISQLHKSLHSVKTFDKDFSREVVSNEKRVNSMELNIDRNCENLFALFNPVAIDLRFVLATLKINNNLERIGDIAEGISKLIISEKQAFDPELLKVTQFLEMYEAAIHIVQDVLNAFDQENTKLARSIFIKDEMLDDINAAVNGVITTYIRENPDKTEQALNVLSIIRKLERVGDQSKNIAEEIIFYLEAKVLKHN
ncbi:phosphate transport system protein [Pedobacter sp. CAN_A7]|uniref:phosphate signaling complex protein PhoU n=1 Tax=Pedobacter sp. CAN_A7 TaxID=2787722 RepID=UPI0018CA425C